VQFKNTLDYVEEKKIWIMNLSPSNWTKLSRILQFNTTQMPQNAAMYLNSNTPSYNWETKICSRIPNPKICLTTRLTIEKTLNLAWFHTSTNLLILHFLQCAHWKLKTCTTQGTKKNLNAWNEFNHMDTVLYKPNSNPDKSRNSLELHNPRIPIQPIEIKK